MNGFFRSLLERFMLIFVHAHNLVRPRQQNVIDRDQSVSGIYARRARIKTERIVREDKRGCG